MDLCPEQSCAYLNLFVYGQFVSFLSSWYIWRPSYPAEIPRSGFNSSSLFSPHKLDFLTVLILSLYPVSDPHRIKCGSLYVILRKLRTKHLPIMADRQQPSVFNLLTVHCQVYTTKFSCFYLCMMINVREFHETILSDSLEMNLILLPSGLICCLVMVLNRFLSLWTLFNMPIPSLAHLLSL